jgi:hypothetical protein
MHMPTNLNILLEEVRLAPNCPYPLRRAVLDVTKVYGLPKKIIKESEFDLAPYDRVEFLEE